MCWTKYIVQHICCRVHIVLDEHCSTQANLQAMSEGNKVCELRDCQQIQTPLHSPPPPAHMSVDHLHLKILAGQEKLLIVHIICSANALEKILCTVCVQLISCALFSFLFFFC